MNPRLLEYVVCPICDAEFVSEAPLERGDVACKGGHRFPVVDGVPRLLREAILTDDDARSIQESFSREWQHFDYERDRAWGQTREERRDLFLKQLDIGAEDLQGRVVLDAGCGVGVLSVAIASLGCEVVAGDIGHQVVDAHRHFTAEGGDRIEGGERTYFVQTNLMEPAFRAGAFDLVYCGGVLHHTPNTKATFDLLVPALAPGGKIFVWLYHNVPGLAYALRMRTRKVLAELPAPLKHALVYALLPQSLLRQRVRIATGRQAPETRLNAREKVITLLDSFTCRYRWEHTPAEVESWYRKLGFTDVKTTDVGKWGFGVVATRPGSQPVSTDEREALQPA